MSINAAAANVIPPGGAVNGKMTIATEQWSHQGQRTTNLRKELRIGLCTLQHAGAEGDAVPVLFTHHAQPIEDLEHDLDIANLRHVMQRNRLVGQ